MQLPKPYFAVLHNWNEIKRSVDISYYLVKNKRTKEFVSRTRLFFIYEKERLRVYKYLKVGSKSTAYLRPRLATEHLQKASGVILPDNDMPWDLKGFLEYVSTFKISKPKKTELCSYCLANRNKWTAVGQESILYKGKRICEMCARREIEGELQKTKLITTPGLVKFYLQQAKRERKLDVILNRMVVDIDTQPLVNPSSTLFDIIEAKKPKDFLKVKNIKPLKAEFKDLLIKEGIKTLMPIQKLALENGLLEGQNLLVVAGTSSGKTLVGELAGVNNALKKKKFVYLSPLVALTNQKYEQFKQRYKKLGLQTAIRVGQSRIEVKGEFKPILDEDYIAADIIVATYEAFDFLLRDGKGKKLKDIGTIVIDEIQMLMAEERGARLNGLIARLKMLFPKAQYIYLSATIGNSEELGKMLEAKCIEYSDRPIPLERHVILTENEDQRLNYLIDLCKNEERIKSSRGYSGQTLVFTNSRRNCENLAHKLSRVGVKATYYHAGLTYPQRKKVEVGFEKGRYSTIVTTIALGAGVDFPASLVVFENLAMGSKWLTVAEFHQMLGRAGRLGYHDKGKVYLLVEPGRKIHVGQSETEEEVAFALLTHPIEPVEPVLDTIAEEEEILAMVVAKGEVSIARDKTVFRRLLGRTTPVSEVMRSLKKLEMIKVENKHIYPTELGKAVSLSFLSPAYALRLVQAIERATKKGFDEDFALTLAVEIEPFKAAYLAPKIHGDIERAIKSTISMNVFSGAVLDLYAGNGWGRGKPSVSVMDTFAKWTKTIFICKCKDKPFCDCGEKEFSKILVRTRRLGLTPTQICSTIRKEYNILLYPGDIYSWLDRMVHHLEAIERLAKVLNVKELKELSREWVKEIEQTRPKRASSST